MSFTPSAPLRRSFKEDREERRRRRDAKIRVRVIAIGSVVAVLGLVGWGVYDQADILATINAWRQPKTAPKAMVAVHTISSSVHPRIKLLAGVTPSPGATPAPGTTPTPAASPTATPAKTPKPKATQVAKTRPNVFALATSFSGPPTPAPLTSVTPAPATQPPATATPAAEVYAPQIVVDARFANRVQPEYPEIAREQGFEGTAVVLVTVGPKGNVLSQRLEKSAGHPALDEAALSAAAHSSFQPPKIDGKPATETYRIVYAFAP